MNIRLAFILIGLILWANCSQKSPLEPQNSIPVVETEKIRQGPKIIGDEEWQQSVISLSSDQTTIVLNRELDTAYRLKPHDIILSTYGEGLLRKVTSIKRETGQVVVETVPVALSEVVEEGTAKFERRLGLQAPHVDYLMDGVQFLSSGLGKATGEGTIAFDFNVLLKDFDGDLITEKDQIRVAGYFQMTVGIDGDLDIKLFKLKKFVVNHHVEQELDANLQVGVPVARFALIQKVAELTYPPITVLLGGVPVVLVPAITLNIGTDIRLNSAIDLNVGEQYAYSVGAKYSDSHWKTYYAFEQDSWFEQPVLSAETSAKVSIHPELKLKIYGTVSPKLTGALFGQIVADPMANPWWRLYAGLDVGLGIDMEIWDQTLFDVRFNFIHYFEEIGRANGGLGGLDGTVVMP